MKEKFIARAFGRQHEVEIREVDALYEVTIDGQAYLVDSCRIDNSMVRSVLLGGLSYETGTVIDGDRYDVHVFGEIIPVEVLDELWARASAGKAERKIEGEVISAPIPGTVVALKVEVGQAVTPGTPIIIVEAMKMQNELTARSTGVVSEIKVKTGDTVTQGQVMVIIKAEVAAEAAAPAS